MKRKIAVYACLVAACAVVASWGFAQEGEKKTTPGGTNPSTNTVSEQTQADTKQAVEDLKSKVEIAKVLANPARAQREMDEKVAKAKADMRSLEAAINSYRVDNNAMPAALKDAEPIPQRVSRAKADMRSLVTGIISYRMDNNAYPACAVGSHSVNTQPQPSFAIPDEKTPFRTLDGPVKYILSYPADPFAAEPKKTFNFYSDKDGWVLWSPGPDGKVDLTTESIKQLYQFKGKWMESRPEIVNYTYDSTNGTVSSGDIIANKPTQSGDMFQVH